MPAPVVRPSAARLRARHSLEVALLFSLVLHGMVLLAWLTLGRRAAEALAEGVGAIQIRAGDATDLRWSPGQVLPPEG